MLYNKTRDGNEADFWILLIGGLLILSAMLIVGLPLVYNSQPIKKDAESKYTVISSNGRKYSNLTKRFHNDSDFTTEQGKRIVFIGNHTTIEE